jgi:hypothetical protein
MGMAHVHRLFSGTGLKNGLRVWGFLIQLTPSTSRVVFLKQAF